MGHTPGPWTMHQWGDNDYEINDAEGTVCNVPGFDDDTVDREKAEPNARLIAAAPEMLESLRRVSAALKELENWRELDATHVDQLIAVDVVADSAIAKAEGRSE